MLAGDGQQVYHAIVDGPQRGGQAGVVFSEFTDAGGFKRCVVDKDRAAFATGGNKGLGKSQRGVAAGEVEKGLVCGPPRAPQAVHAELEGDLLIGPRAEQAEQRLSQAAASFSWQWGALWAGTAGLLLAVVLGIVLLVVPSPAEIAALRAEVANLEARGGKATLTVCGDKKRLCAEIDTKAPEYGERGQFRILKGY